MAVIVFAVWKFGLPWLKEKTATSSRPASAAKASPPDDCVAAAENASELWGSQLSRFVRPPVDRESWSSFRMDVERSIDQARSSCSCASDSCRRATTAMSDLQSIVRDLDAAVATGAPVPGDIVSRQQQVDEMIEGARRVQ